MRALEPVGPREMAEDEPKARTSSSTTQLAAEAHTHLFEGLEAPACGAPVQESGPPG